VFQQYVIAEKAGLFQLNNPACFPNALLSNAFRDSGFDLGYSWRFD
jgi:hypothetical protein